MLSAADLSRLYNHFLGKNVLLIGQPWIGKTMLAHQLAIFFPRTYYFRIEKNFTPKDYPNHRRIKYYNIDNPDQLIENLQSLNQNGCSNGFIVLDSITIAELMFLKGNNNGTRYKVTNECKKMIRTFYELVLHECSLLKEKGNTILNIAHEITLATGKFTAKANNLLLRQVEMIVRMYGENGKRKIKVVAKRGQALDSNFELEGFDEI